MNVKRTATIAVIGGALAAWLAGAATSNRSMPLPIVTETAPIDARGAALANEIARLHEGQLFMVKEGENVTPRFRVVKISADVVELLDLSTNTPRRLALR